MEYWSLLMLDGAVIGGSFLLFFVLSRTMLLLLRRSAAQAKITEDVEKSGIPNYKRRSFHAEDNQSLEHQNLSAEIPGLLLVSVGGIAVVIAAVITTDVLSHPLSTGGQSPLTRYALLSSAGHHAYRLVACAFFGASRDRMTSLVSHAVALMTYSTVAFTREDTMLGISGLVYQAPFVLFVPVNKRQDGQWLRACLSFVATLVFLLILPTCSTGYSMFKESIPEALSLWSTCVLFLSLVYFGLLGLWILAIHIRRLQRRLTAECNSATNIESANERTKLLVPETVKVIGQSQETN